MFSLRGRGLPAAFAIAAVIGGSPAASPPAAAQADPDIIIWTSGDRVSSAPGSLSSTGGMVTGVQDATYRVTGPGGFSHDCTSDANGECRVTVDPNADYTVRQVSAPDGYFLSPILGTGPATTPPSSVSTVYSTLSVHVGTTNVNVPAGTTTYNASDTARSGRWAVSRDNPPLSGTCVGRKVALLFDLSASISTSDFNTYETSAADFVRALEGTNTTVTVFTFGTVAPAPSNTTFSGNTSDPTELQNLLTRIANIAPPRTDSFTNWDAGIWQIVQWAQANGPFNEALVLTDGDPTVYSSNGTPDNVTGGVNVARTRFRDIENGIFAANALKAQGTRIIAVGLIVRSTTASAPAGSVANLKSISGPDEDSDYFLRPFASLAEILNNLALQNCAVLSIEKSASPATYDHVGQEITYTFKVTNTSNEGGFSLNDITLTDTPTGTGTLSEIKCDETELDVGASTTCTATYTVTQADLDAGTITNTAYASGTTDNGNTVESPEDSETVTAVPPVEMLKIVKSASPDTVSTAGTTVTYTYRVTNVGEGPVDKIVIKDTSTGTGHMSEITCEATSLAPGESTTCTSTYTVTAADIAAGHVANVAVVAGAGPDGEKATSNRTKITVMVTRPLPVTG